jgi:hypothetical protein
VNAICAEAMFWASNSKSTAYKSFFILEFENGYN